MTEFDEDDVDLDAISARMARFLFAKKIISVVRSHSEDCTEERLPDMTRRLDQLKKMEEKLRSGEPDIMKEEEKLKKRRWAQYQQRSGSHSYHKK